MASKPPSPKPVRGKRAKGAAASAPSPIGAQQAAPSDRASGEIDAALEAELDDALRATFPASDPIAIDAPPSTRRGTTTPRRRRLG